MCTRPRLDVLGKEPWKEVFQEAVAKTWKSSFSWGLWWCLHLFAWRITCERGSILHSVAWQGAGGGDRRAMNSGHAPQQRYGRSVGSPGIWFAFWEQAKLVRDFHCLSHFMVWKQISSKCWILMMWLSVIFYFFKDISLLKQKFHSMR